MPSVKRIADLLKTKGHPSFRLKQVLHGIFKLKARKFADIPAIPGAVKSDLVDAFGQHVVAVSPAHEQSGDQAHKVLFELADGVRSKKEMSPNQGLRGLFLNPRCG